ncbi:hypothetical protein F3Y22_tig00112343pilonHSYRG00122 [Hibiscus syriacus]|uniref:Uncharacterized protein n=1 Tax=Hibiscus syriacus TaxID=106335 RepID=A0A6A2XF20_HIBSY|nr:hypothetical protein F3Y22_tig00112343pilonHSYRG00122 [Hibiscus syriacus]
MNGSFHVPNSNFNLLTHIVPQFDRLSYPEKIKEEDGIISFKNSAGLGCYPNSLKNGDVSSHGMIMSFYVSSIIFDALTYMTLAVDSSPSQGRTPAICRETRDRNRSKLVRVEGESKGGLVSLWHKAVKYGDTRFHQMLQGVSSPEPSVPI